MKKTPLGTIKIDNGMVPLIERYPPIRNRYIKGTMKKLKSIPGARQYARSQVYRVITDRMGLNDENKAIKTAFLAYYREVAPAELTAQLAV